MGLSEKSNVAAIFWQRIMDDANLRKRTVYSVQQYSFMDRLRCPSLLLADELDRSALRLHTYLSCDRIE